MQMPGSVVDQLHGSCAMSPDLVQRETAIALPDGQKCHAMYLLSVVLRAPLEFANATAMLALIAMKPCCKANVMISCTWDAQH